MSWTFSSPEQFVTQGCWMLGPHDRGSQAPWLFFLAFGSAHHGSGSHGRIARLNPHVDDCDIAGFDAAMAFSKVGTRSACFFTGSKPTAPCALPTPAQSMSGSEMR